MHKLQRKFYTNKRFLPIESTDAARITLQKNYAHPAQDIQWLSENYMQYNFFWGKQGTAEDYSITWHSKNPCISILYRAPCAKKVLWNMWFQALHLTTCLQKNEKQPFNFLQYLQLSFITHLLNFA